MSRPRPNASAEWQAVAAHKERIKGWLTNKRPLRLTKVPYWPATAWR
jgi:hypothetical protein